MPDFITQTARLVPYAKRPKQAPGFVTAYAYEPLPTEPGADLGNLYAVIEVLISGRASEELCDLIIETLGNKYYNNNGASEDSEARFEDAVRAVNNELAEHVNRGNAAWIGKLSAVVALQTGQDLHLSHTGSAEAFFYRGKKTASRITASSPDKRPANPSKTFGSIASGLLEVGDRLLLATPALIHQISLSRLQNVISDNTPNSAIAEITRLLHGTATDRIACLVIEVTTPELAALKVRSEAPSEIHLGSPETPIEAAKVVAAPIARTTAKSGKKVFVGLNKTLVRLRRRARSLSLSLADQTRQSLSSRRGRRTAAIITAFGVLVIVGLIWHAQTAGHSATVFRQYQSSYSDFTQAQVQLAAGNPASAKDSAGRAQKQYAALKPNMAVIDRQLAAQSKLPAGEPRTYTAYGQQLADLMRELSPYTSASPSTVADLPASSRPAYFELSGIRAYVVDTAGGQIDIVNLDTGSAATSKVSLKPIGIVKGTTISPTGTGMYILTDAPGVWFYNFQADSLTKQSPAYDHWPAAGAIGAYLSNLYLLSDSQVFKYAENQTGWSPGIPYLKSSHPAQTNQSALAVDGSIFLAVASDLERYTAGTKTGATAIPGGAAGLANLNSTSDGTFTVGAQTKGPCILVWSTSDKFALNRDIQLTGVKTIYDAIYDPASSALYATVDHRLVRLTYTP